MNGGRALAVKQMVRGQIVQDYAWECTPQALACRISPSASLKAVILCNVMSHVECHDTC